MTAQVPTVERRKLRVLFITVYRGGPIEEDPFYGQVFLGFHRASQSGTDFEIISRYVGDEVNLEQVLEESPAFDVCLLNYPASDRDIEHLERHGIRFLCMGHPGCYRTVPKIDIDNFYGAFIGAEHLISRGYRRVALLHHNYAEALQQQAISGYRHACSRHGLEVDERLIHRIAPYDSSSSEDCIGALIADRIEFDGLLVMGDWATYGAMNMLKRHHVQIPRDVGLVSYDAYPWIVNGFKPRPTHIILPFAKMAEKALLMLAAQEKASDGVVMQALIKPELYLGQTS